MTIFIVSCILVIEILLALMLKKSTESYTDKICFQLQEKNNREIDNLNIQIKYLKLILKIKGIYKLAGDEEIIDLKGFKVGNKIELWKMEEVEQSKKK